MLQLFAQLYNKIGSHPLQSYRNIGQPMFSIGSPMFPPPFDYFTGDEGEVDAFDHTIHIVLVNTFGNGTRDS